MKRMKSDGEVVHYLFSEGGYYHRIDGSKEKFEEMKPPWPQDQVLEYVGAKKVDDTWTVGEIYIFTYDRGEIGFFVPEYLDFVLKLHKHDDKFLVGRYDLVELKTYLGQLREYLSARVSQDVNKKTGELKELLRLQEAVADKLPSAISG